MSGPLAAPAPWDFVAAGYDATTRGFLEKFSRSGLAELRYDAATRVIDVACGPGTTALLLAPQVASVTCVDFSPAMLERLGENAAAANATNIDAVEADGQALPFPDAPFDLGISMFGLMFFPDRPRGWSELYRVLAPGGQALVSSWAPMERSTYTQAVVAALRPEGLPPSGTPPTGLEDPDVFEAEMRSAGFADVVVRDVAHSITVEDVGAFWRDQLTGSAPVSLWKNSIPLGEWEATEAAALARLRRHLGNLPAVLSATAWIGTGRKA